MPFLILSQNESVMSCLFIVLNYHIMNIIDKYANGKVYFFVLIEDAEFKTDV